MSPDFPPRPVPPEGKQLDDFDKILYQGRVDDHVALLKEAREAERKPAEHEFELLKIRRQAEADDEFAQKKEERDHDFEREKLDWSAELELYKLIHEARSKIAADSLTRGLSGAEFVRNAAAAIVTIYTGVLAVAFDVASKKVIPPRGLVPAAFLAVSVALAAAYVAFLSRAPEIEGPQPSDSLRVIQERRLNKFIDWATGLALQRAWALHAAVVALGLGAATLPLPFVSISGKAVGAILVVGVLVLLLAPTITSRGGSGNAPAADAAAGGSGGGTP